MIELSLQTMQNLGYESQYGLTQPFNLSQFHDSKVDVILYQYSEDIKEYINDVPAIRTWNGDIELKPLLESLRSMDLFTGRNLYFYHSQTSNMDIFCGKDPVSHDSIIPFHDIIQKDGKLVVFLKLKPDETPAPVNNGPNNVHDIRHLQYKTIRAHLDAEEESDSSESKNGKSKKKKEKCIGEVINLLNTWKRMINGVVDPQSGQCYQFSSEAAAKKLGVSELTMDYYLLQIQCAKQHGFDFNISLKKKFSVIRSFIKLFNTKKDILKSFCFLDHDGQEEKEKTVEKCKRTKKIQK